MLKQGTFDKTHCLATQDDNWPCGAELQKMDANNATQDKLGNWWCNAHKDRATLINYGYDHGYPLIRFVDDDGRPCAIGGNRKDADLYKVVALLAKSSVIAAAVRHIATLDEHL